MRVSLSKPSRYPLLAAFLPGRPFFAINTYIAQSPVIRPFLRFVRTFPLDPTNPMATKALIAANPDRLVWGSDWPHPDSVTPPGKKATDLTPLYQIDDGRVLNQLAVWAPDAATRKKILVDNPARLYGFS